ncbi:hypothetical protein ALC62_03858 [Cyphomyrmex costatus]|uniref:Mutator-like transposase domain-containing protein n=1 Tax=Cyphomyrmex costatus TaxID=456900 RepID=A0A151IKX3_9HYME|nr:hypothetical protein ALC62_03858 [Cyphomyrmex costatus]
MAENNNALIAIAILMLDSSSDDSSSTDSDEELINAVQIIRDKRPRIQNYIEVITLYDDKEFKSHFRLRRSTFEYVLNSYRYKQKINASFYKNILGQLNEIFKKECVLHVKKRLYRRANEAKKQLAQIRKSAKRETAKQLSVKKIKKGTKSTKKTKSVELTIKLMKELPIYFELAVRRHPESIEDMRNAIWATFYHKISSDDEPQHSRCPAGPDSWCKYRKAEANNTLQNFQHPPALSEEVQPFLKSIYEDLTTDDLLERCLGANTQNSNESYNACVWHLAPKHMFAGKKIIEIAAYCAACTFNEGHQPLLKITEVMDITIGQEAATFVQKHNEARNAQFNRRTSDASKDRRTAIRNERMEENAVYDEVEGIMYAAGIAD